jgi:metal-responsive CopG/Arc/MetJ family transcriptional regulator
MTKKATTVSVRFPQHVYDDLSKIAARETRSLSQQVIHFVKQGIASYESQKGDSTTAGEGQTAAS